MGDFSDKKKTQERRGVSLKGGINGLVILLPNENIKSRLHGGDDYLKKKKKKEMLGKQEDVKKRKNLLSQNKQRIKKEL